MATVECCYVRMWKRRQCHCGQWWMINVTNTWILCMFILFINNTSCFQWQVFAGSFHGLATTCAGIRQQCLRLSFHYGDWLCNIISNNDNSTDYMTVLDCRRTSLMLETAFAIGPCYWNILKLMTDESWMIQLADVIGRYIRTTHDVWNRPILSSVYYQLNTVLWQF